MDDVAGTEERPGAFNLKKGVAHNSATLTGSGPVEIVTPSQQWAFAVTFPLQDDPLNPLDGHRRMIIHLDATVEEGEIGVSVARPDTGELITIEDRQGTAGRTTFEVLLNTPRPGVWLVVRNCADNGIASRIIIHSIRAYLTDAPQLEESFGSGATAEPVSEIWLDVGAHLGERTFAIAAASPSIRVYAFEPNLRVASRLMGRLSNYVVLPIAIAEQDGCSPFYLNRDSAGSSLLPLAPEGVKQWVGEEIFQVEETVTVPTLRLDTFLNQAGIVKVAYLKIDAQGGDLSVLRSAGTRLQDIQRITLEVQITPVPLYRGAPRKEEVMAFLNGAGFELVSSEKQSHDQEENLTFVRRGDRHS